MSDSLPPLTSPAPVREFILKVASRCNLDCDYCYEYHHGDDSWKLARKIISLEVVEEAARKIAKHAKDHALDDVSISLHGGEPLLLGEKRLARVASTIRQIVESAGVRVMLGMQTNGVLISEAIAEVIRDQRIYVGISLDGSRSANDRHRLDHRGQSSHSRVLKGIETLQQIAPDFTNGVLAVIDLENDPVQTFDELVSLGFQNIDFLLPHFNWDRPPPRSLGNATAYGEWYEAIWNAWVQGRHSHVRIRFLDNIVARLVGHPGIYEQMSDAPIQLLTITPDGDFEGVDTLKSTGSGVQQMGLNILRNEIDDVLTHPLYAFRQNWKANLPTACEGCSIKTICTAGYIPHRYKTGTGFNNPSVYCRDIQHIVSSIDGTIRQNMRKTA